MREILREILREALERCPEGDLEEWGDSRDISPTGGSSVQLRLRHESLEISRKDRQK